MKIEMIVASTLDGFIAQNPEQSSLDWTSRADKIFFTRKSKAAKFLVMGATTFKTVELDKITKGRVIIVLTSEPTAIAEAKTDWDQFSPELDAGIFAFKMTVEELIAELEKRGVPELLIGGGVGVYRQFWQTGRVEKIYLTIEPIIFGAGMSLGSALEAKNGNWQKLKIAKVEKLDPENYDTVMMELVKE